MIVWIVLAVYVIGFAFTWRRFALRLIEDDRKRFPELWRYKEHVREVREFGAIMGALISIVWFLVPAWYGIRAALRSDLLLTDSERVARAEAEAEARLEREAEVRWAHDNGIALPDVNDDLR